MPSLRVAMILQNYLPHIGGAERQLATIAPLLQARGVEVQVLTRRHRGLKPYEELGGVPVHRLPVPGPKPVAALSFTLHALLLLQRLRPDVLHAYSIFSPTTTAVAAKRLFGTPVAVKLLRGGALGDLTKLRRAPGGAGRMAAFRRQVDAFVTISQEIDNELAAIGVAADRRPFIPNGVDTERFAPASADERRVLRARLGLPDGPLAVFTGRLEPEKRLDVLLGLWPAVRAAQSDAQLLILGQGAEAAQLRRLAGAGVHFGGRVDDVAPYLRAADVFVLPSASEGLSNALLEALAAGLAVVATNVGGAADVVQHGASGLLVPADDPQALRQALIAVVRDAGLRTHLAGQARQRLVCDYSLATTADRLVALYQQLTGRQRVAAP